MAMPWELAPLQILGSSFLFATIREAFLLIENF